MTRPNTHKASCPALSVAEQKGGSDIGLMKGGSSLMNAIRKLICWLFAISAVLCLWNATRLGVYIAHRHDAFQSLRSLLIAAILPVLAAIYLVAWWTVWKEKPSTRGWGIAASLTYVLLPICGTLYSSRSLPSSIWAMLGIGVLGLIAFSWRQVSGPLDSRAG